MKLEREHDVEVLRQAAMILEKENQRLVNENLALQRRVLALEGKSPEELQTRLAALEGQLAVMRDRMFGPSSEKRPSVPAAPREREPQTGHGPREQPQLKVAHVLHVLDEADRACPACGGQLEEFKGQHETSEEIDVVERQFVLRKHYRQKYRCGCNGHVETAPGPEKLFPGSRYSIDFAIEVAAAKYLDHAPLERQVRTMAREGLVIDSQTLWDVIERLAQVVKDLPERIAAHVLASAVIGADETRWRLLGKNGDDGGATNWQAWAMCCPNAIAYRIQDSRSTQAARNLIGEFAGIVMADGYGAYQALRKQGGKFRLAHCWSHVRRKFDEVQAFFPTECGQILDLIGELYAVEKLCPTGPPGDELRRQLRNERSREILSRIQRWVLETRALPESGLGKAITYMTGLWPGLIVFLDDPRVWLDNNATERGMRGLVVGRKNHYGSKSRRGTEVAALYYSIFETAKLAGVDPKAYLRRAVHAALRGARAPLPHELAASAAAPA